MRLYYTSYIFSHEIDYITEFVIWHNFKIKDVFIYIFNLQSIFGTHVRGGHLCFPTNNDMLYYYAFSAMDKSKKNQQKYGNIISIWNDGVSDYVAYVTDI